VAPALIENASLREIEEELGRLSAAAAEPGQVTTLRARVLTHVAWIPPEWEEAARGVLEGLRERHPSRGIMLLPDSASARDALDAEVDLRCFAHRGPEQTVCSEVIVIRLRGNRAAAPASVVEPLLVSDLPVFLRWRGVLPHGAPELEQLVDVADRLIVDSDEWPDPEASYERLAELFERVAVSDIAWARTEPWRAAVAALWPDVADASQVRVRGPRADALLLARWLGARLRRNVELEHESASEIELVEVDGRRARPNRLEAKSPSDLLSDQLEIFGRDPIYEEAVWSSTLATT
jgi:glucose-6-phosphate dehydrogenase assembly protein OpcA